MGGLFNLIFLSAGAGVVEIPPCGVPLSLVFNVAELFGIAFHEILDSSCDETFMQSFTKSGCATCVAREIRSSGSRSTDIDSVHFGDCAGMASACDVRAAQTVTLNNIAQAAKLVLAAHRAAEARMQS